MLSDFVPVVGAAWRLNGGGNEDTLGTMVLLKEEATGEGRERELTVVFAFRVLSRSRGWIFSFVDKWRERYRSCI